MPRKHTRKKCKMPPPPENFAQGFWFCMVLILIQHDQRLENQQKTLYVCNSTVSRGSARLTCLIWYWVESLLWLRLSLLDFAACLSPPQWTQFGNFVAATFIMQYPMFSLKVVSGSSKVMDNKASGLNVAYRFRSIMLGLRLTQVLVWSCVHSCLDLHVSVSARRGNENGLAKPFLRQQIK